MVATGEAQSGEAQSGEVPPCDWDRCDQPARLAVLVGPAPDHASLDGWFCVPHAALASVDARERGAAPTWFDGIRVDGAPSRAARGTVR